MLFCKATESVYNNTNDFSAAAIQVLVLVAQFTESGAFFFIQSYYYYRYFVFFFKNIFVSAAVFPGVNHRGRKCSVMTSEREQSALLYCVQFSSVC